MWYLKLIAENVFFFLCVKLIINNVLYTLANDMQQNHAFDLEKYSNTRAALEVHLRSLITAMECKLITKMPYKDNKYLTIQRYQCLDPPLAKLTEEDKSFKTRCMLSFVLFCRTSRSVPDNSISIKLFFIRPLCPILFCPNTNVFLKLYEVEMK